MTTRGARGRRAATSRRRPCGECGKPMAKSLDRIRAETHPGCYELTGPDEDTTTWPEAVVAGGE